uniref:Uncharacterized protein n=1 Tax=Sphenodon punctatus TaxID=8508 RepID=A0A8D0H0A8_SPHPU
MHSSEDEQYSFRPSTSPLIHSSPSEASGTTLSGLEADSSCAVSHFKRTPCNDSMLPQSIYSSPSVSRLTYVSAADNTLTRTVVPSPERHQSNIVGELSTTIIQASPTSLVEQTSGKTENVLG